MDPRLDQDLAGGELGGAATAVAAMRIAVTASSSFLRQEAASRATSLLAWIISIPSEILAAVSL